MVDPRGRQSLHLEECAIAVEDELGQCFVSPVVSLRCNLQDLLELLECMDCGSPPSRPTSLVRYESWSIQPNIAIRHLKRVYMPVQSYICPINLSPHIKDDLSAMFDAWPCLNRLTSFLEVEGNLEDLILLAPSL